MALLSVERLRVEFPTRRGLLVAVDDVSFSIAPGEVLGVVGESGAGKSLTGAAIIGLIDPPGRIGAGQVVLDGRRIDNLPAEAMRRVRGREIGAVFQDPLTSLNPLYTIGRQLIETITTHLDMSPREARQRALDLLAEVGISAPTRRIDHYPHQFSGGMRQRIVIAICLALKPELIIMDEPTTALDVVVQREILQQVEALKQDFGFAVLFITHDLSLLLEFADRIAIMYAGEIVETAPSAQLHKNPQHPYTRGLMESFPPLTGPLQRLVGIPGSPPDLADPPSGCRFHPRCPLCLPDGPAYRRQTTERPKLRLVGTEHFAACHLVEGAS
jgi:peptide/nickel transport system ATP-binding protein